MISGLQHGYRVLMVIPVYRDWESVSILCRGLDAACAELSNAAIRVMLVDDASGDGLDGWQPFAPQSLESIDVLFLRRNLGHQRAITTGLCYVHESAGCDLVLIMDADGEDRPEDALELVKRALQQPRRIIFAERRRRLEGRVFRTGYSLYRVLHRLLTGIPVRVGNFSVLPACSLGQLASMSEMWNHYAGAVFKSKLEYDVVPLDRGRRYRGESRMNLVGLVSHGLAGIASFYEVVATRILIAAALGALFTMTALVGVAAVRMFTRIAIPEWVVYATGLLLLLLAQMLATAFTLVFTLITARVNGLFVPMRDYKIFVDRVETLWASSK